VTVPAVSRQLHQVLLSRQNQAAEFSDGWEYNRIIGKGPLGIVSNGVALNYVLDAVNDLGLTQRTSILKLGMTHPLPKDLCLTFLKQVESVFVVEELEPII
jgi:indolepyruvate ferredoxin oxidoreductase alpha subunit